MLEALADKYAHLGIDKSAQDWEIILFNHLCGFLDLENEMIDLIAEHNKEIAIMDKSLIHQKKIEKFICSTLVGPDALFKIKLKKLMNKQGLSLKFKNGEPHIQSIS